MQQNENASMSGGSGQKAPICPACKGIFNGYQDVERHFQFLHLPCPIFCPHSARGCRWRGSCIDDLEKHLDIQKCGPKPAEQQYQIYDVKLILSWIKNLQSSNDISKTQKFAVELVKERALELERQDWLEDPWGFSAERRHRA